MEKRAGKAIKNCSSFMLTVPEYVSRVQWSAPAAVYVAYISQSESVVGVSISGTPGTSGTASHLVIGLISHTATLLPTLTCLGKGYQTNFVFL